MADGVEGPRGEVGHVRDRPHTRGAGRKGRAEQLLDPCRIDAQTAVRLARKAATVSEDVSLDYPMVAPNYAKQRSELARALGLGQQRRRGLAKVSAQDALKVEAFEEAAESLAGEASSDDPALAEAVAPEGAATTAEGKRASKPRARRRKGEPALA
jgi:ROS/MUCR transcriptional regulator protein